MAKKAINHKEMIAKLFKILIVFGIYALIGLVLFLIYHFSGITIQDIQSYLVGIGNWGYILFILIQVLTNVLLFIIPGQTLQFIALGLALYSPLETFFLVLIGMIIASFINFMIGRVLGKNFVMKIIGEATYLKYQSKLAAKAYIYYPIMMVLPFFPDDELTLLVGLTKMNLFYFLIVTTLTRAIGVAIFTFIPGQLNFNNLGTTEFILLGLAFLHIVTMLFYLVRNIELAIEKYIK
jgi:uncharacterized membrane protein YdjX (TVP38/TMEM64 family)